MTNKNIPKFDELLNPLFISLKHLGGSGTNGEIYEKVVDLLNLPDDVLENAHSGSYNQTGLSIRLSWAKVYLKKYGAITNTSRGIWVINGEFTKIEKLDPKDVVKTVRSLDKKAPGTNRTDNGDSEEYISWREQVREILTSMDPSAFEKLSQILLRESGITNVDVTDKSGDGGIDGTGQLKIHGLISFKMAFQCKRYAGNVHPNEIRDFRGSMTTDVEKGLFITTGGFTDSARKEASMPGKKSIDLVNGDELIDKLADLELGLKPIRAYEVDEKFFKEIL